MNKTAQALTKLALTFGATRNLLRELQRKGTKVHRVGGVEAKYHLPKKVFNIETATGRPSEVRKAWDRVSKSRDIEHGGPGGGKIYLGNSVENPRYSLFHEAGHALGKTNKITKGHLRARPEKIPVGKRSFIYGSPNKPHDRRIGTRKVLAMEIDADKTALQLIKKHGGLPKAGREYLKKRKSDHNTYMSGDAVVTDKYFRGQEGPIPEMGKIRNAYNKVTQKEFKDWT